MDRFWFRTDFNFVMDLFRIILVHRNQYTPEKEEQKTNVKILIVKCINVNVFCESVTVVIKIKDMNLKFWSERETLWTFLGSYWFIGTSTVTI